MSSCYDEKRKTSSTLKSYSARVGKSVNGNLWYLLGTLGLNEAAKGYNRNNFQFWSLKIKFLA